MLMSPLPALQDNMLLALIDPYIPEQTLAIHHTTAISQRQFLLDVHHIAGQLPEGDFALNLCQDRYYFLLAFCALLIKGAVNLLPPNRQPATLAELAKEYRDCYCLFDNSQTCELPSLSLHNLLQNKTTTATASLPVFSAQQIAAIAFTSGTTGSPKPNQKCWGTLAATARLLGQKLTAHLSLPTLIATVPAQHIYGLEILMMSLQAQTIMHSAKPFYPVEVQQLLRQLNAPCILLSTPTHLRALTQAEIAMPELAAIISATAQLEPQLASASERCFNAPLWEIYGCTEAGAMAVRRSTQTLYWQLLEGFSLQSTDDGYLARAPHLSEIALIPDQLNVPAKGGKFLLSGRNSDMIKVAGKRSSLAHLTYQLLRIEGVDDGVVFLPPAELQSEGRPTETRPVALVVSNLPEKHILAALAKTIDAVFLPRPLRKVKRLPRNETGKLTAATLNELWSHVNDQ